jgi:putative FmdB family regulatory protein
LNIREEHMPLYEFRCASCGDEFELLVRNQERAACPACESSKLERLMSASVGHVGGRALPIAGGCPPSDAPPCGPGCCRMPGI